MKYVFQFLFVLVLIQSCQSQQVKSSSQKQTETKAAIENKILAYQKLHPDSTTLSISSGQVGKGTLKHGKLMPFEGTNYFYFDTSSYLAGRAFVNQKVKSLCLDSYEKLKLLLPGRKFGIMECSNEHGGKLHPHLTHQNGLSVDFMTPMLSGDTANYSLDHTGIQHYFLEFDNEGHHLEHREVSIDFNTMAQHILSLNELAQKHGLKISKVLFKIELKDDLFASKYGKQLLQTGIYFAKNLSPLVNKLHDDHYHIDFEEL